MLNFWTRLVSGKKEKIALALYHKLRDLYDTNEYTSPWINCIKTTLDEIGQSDLWNEIPENINPVKLKPLFDEKLKSNFGQQWLDQIQTTSACSTYSIFKQDLKFEPYLLQLDPNLAISLCKFRCISNQLPVVTGRYNNTPRVKRKCNLCTSGDVGDEFHYIFKCSHFNTDRIRLINHKYLHGANISKIKLKHLFNSESESELSNLAKFTKIILCQFNETPGQTSSARSKTKKKSSPKKDTAIIVLCI